MTPWTVACQASLFMGFPRQEYWSGLPFPLPGDLPDPGVKPTSLASLALAFFTAEPPGEAPVLLPCIKLSHCHMSFLILSLCRALYFLPFSLPACPPPFLPPSFLYFRHSLTDMKSKHFCHGSSLFLCDAKYPNTWKHLVIWQILFRILGFPGGRYGKEVASHWALVVKSLPVNAGDVRDTGSMPRSGRSSGGGHGNPLQYSCLENSHGQRSLAGYSP